MSAPPARTTARPDAALSEPPAVKPLLPDHIPDVWRGGRSPQQVATLPTGFAALDRRLPGAGWPLGALTELLNETPGAGELSLLLPALASLTRKQQWVVLVDPPWLPYPPAMFGHGIALERLLLVRTQNPRESLWACEQALRGVRGGAVLAWQEDPGFTRLRRLQLAARAGLKSAFLFRSMAQAEHTSPAVLRLQLQADPAGCHVTVLKCRGRTPAGRIFLRRPLTQPGAHRADQPVTDLPDPPADSEPLNRAAGADAHVH